MTAYVWTKDHPTKGGLYWVRAASCAVDEFAAAVGVAARQVRIVDYGGGPAAEVDMRGTSFRGEGWQTPRSAPAYTLEFAGPIYRPTEPS